jgi:hypothetical protein
LRKAVRVGDDQILAGLDGPRQQVLWVGDRAPRAELLDDVMVGLSQQISPVLAGFSVGLVDVRFAAEKLLSLTFRVGE